MISSYIVKRTVEDRRDRIRALIKEVDPMIQEVTTYSSDTMIVTTPSDVSRHFGSSKAYVTIKFIEDVVKLEIGSFPITEERKQFVSLCLAPLCITTVGFNSEKNSELYKYIALLGATYSRQMNETVTLLVTKTMLSHKTEEARKIGLPIVTFKWLKACYNHLLRIPIDEYQFTLFLNCVFTSSDFTPKENKELKQCIESNGGSLIDILDDSVDIVIASSITMTKKIKIALKSEIPIVKPEWIRDSVARNGAPLSNGYVINWWIRSDTKSDLFSDMSFFTKNETLRKAILANSGKICDNESDAQYIVTEFGQNSAEITDKHVTEKWIYKCIETNRIVDISSSILNRPLMFDVPIKEFVGRAVSLLDMNDNQRSELSDAIRVLGGVPMWNIHKNTELAIALTMNEKVRNAQIKHPNVTFIKPNFIRDFLISGKVPDIESYSLQKEMKDKLNSLCASIKSTKILIQRNKKKGIRFDEESLHSDTSEVEADVVYDSRQKHRFDTTSKSPNDPLMSALSSSGF